MPGWTTTCRPTSSSGGIGWATPILAMLTGSGLFGEPQTVPDGADAQTRLLALVGRTR